LVRHPTSRFRFPTKPPRPRALKADGEVSGGDVGQRRSDVPDRKRKRKWRPEAKKAKAKKNWFLWNKSAGAAADKADFIRFVQDISNAFFISVFPFVHR
jgi:hypothetical protein